MSADTTNVILAFLDKVQIRVTRGEVDDTTFLPGIEVVDGELVVDESKLNYPGDLLHEAGHLAVAPPTLRARLSGKVETPDSNPDVIESAAMLWSYAACIHLGMEPRVVFHDKGYHGQSANLLLNFELGVLPGLHVLEASGMTLSPAEATMQGLKPFPVMQKWLRD